MMNRALLYGILKNKTGAEISASGNPAVLEGTVEGRAVKDAKIYGWSKQNSTTGAQLLDLQESDIRPNTGLTATLQDGALTVSGTPAAAYVQIISKEIHLEPGIYYVSGGKKESGYVYSQMNIKRSDGTRSYLSGIPIYIDGTEQEIQYVIQTLNTGAAVENYTMHPMLNTGDKALPWEPYTGGQPSPSLDYPQEIESAGSLGKINMVLSGRNLIGKWEYGAINADTGTVIPYKKISTSIYSGYIPVDSSNTYRLSMSNAKPSSTSKGRAYDANLVYLGVFQMDIWKVNIPEGVKYIRYEYNEYTQGDAEKIMNGTAGIMLNIGTTALPYEPYSEPQSLSIQTPNGLPAIPVNSGGNYTDADGQQWIADYVDFARGKYVQWIWEREFNGSETWLPYVTKGFEGFFIVTLPVVTYKRDGYSNLLRKANDNTEGLWIGANNNYLYCHNSRFYDSTLDDKGLANFKSHLAEHPLTVMTYLDEPIERDLTQEELEAYKNLTTCTGTTIVENDADCYMEVSSTTGDTLRAKKLALLLGD